MVNGGRKGGGRIWRCGGFRGMEVIQERLLG